MTCCKQDGDAFSSMETVSRCSMLADCRMPKISPKWRRSADATIASRADEMRRNSKWSCTVPSLFCFFLFPLVCSYKSKRLSSFHDGRSTEHSVLVLASLPTSTASRPCTALCAPARLPQDMETRCIVLTGPTVDRRRVDPSWLPSSFAVAAADYLAS